MPAATSNARGRRSPWGVATRWRTSALAAGNDAATDLAGFADRAPLRLLAYLMIGLSFLFMAFPGIDISVSALFTSPQGSFPLADDRLLTDIRDLNRFLPKLILTGLATTLLGRAFLRGQPIPVAPHKALFVLAVYGLGGGVIVHALKNLVGRARPDDILAFGGTDAFSVAWQLSGACARNCSFSSGEAASAMAMLALTVLVPGRFRLPALIVLAPLAVLFSGARIAIGAHFLSDVVVSWLILLILMVVLWRVFRFHADTIDRAVVGAGLPLITAARSRLVWLLLRRAGKKPDATRSPRASAAIGDQHRAAGNQRDAAPVDRR